MNNTLTLNDSSNYDNWGIKACIYGLKTILNSGDKKLNIAGFPHTYMQRKYNYDLKIYNNGA